MGNRSNLKAVEKARISHSDDMTSSNALLNQRVRGFWELSLFSEVTTISRLEGLQSAGMEGCVWDASGGTVKGV